MKPKPNPVHGFTLLEILITMVMFGVFLTVTIQLLTSQNKMNTTVLSFSDLTADARMSTVRMTELLSQAAYIYPAGQTINLPGGVNITTGKEALAFLLASQTPYCTAVNRRYCAVMYRIENRSNYTAILGASSQASPHVLTERIYISFDWPQIPQGGSMPTNWSALALTNNIVGLVADSVDNVQTDLGSAAMLSVSPRPGEYDAGLKTGVPATSSIALIQAVKPRVVLRLLPATPNRSAIREFSVFAQPIPRQGPLDN